MRIDTLSAGATAHHNEDLAAVFDRDGVLDVVVLDGATSVADRDHVDTGRGDVVWFVHRFAEALQALPVSLDQQQAVHDAIDTVARQYDAHESAPVHAWPIAALTWVRIAGGKLHLYCLGDCKTLLGLPDGSVTDLDPYTNPQEAVLQQEIARLRAAGIDDPSRRKELLLPMLRARREQQNTAPAPTILCLRPNGAFAPRRDTVEAPPGAQLLVATDGFYRLVDPYGLYTPQTLLRRCGEDGLDAALRELRAYEDNTAGGTSVKRADDASAVLWQA